jgi:diguanylate cyclase (GGDEF)-like protein/PAS domain S-box-containing protein
MNVQLLLRRRLLSVAVAAAAIGSLISALSFEFARGRDNHAAQLRFDRRAEVAGSVLRERFRTYEQILRGIAAVSANTGIPPADRWRAYVAAIQAPAGDPAIASFAYIHCFSAADLAGYELGAQAWAGKAFHLRPAGERAVYAPLTLREPAGDGADAGFDLLTDPLRRPALERARDTGGAALATIAVQGSGSTALAPPTVELYLPVYRSELPHATAEQRRLALSGYVEAQLLIDRLAREAFGDRLDGERLQIYDESGAAAQPVFDSLPQPGTRRALRFAADAPVDIAGQPWLVRASALPDFVPDAFDWAPFLLLGGLTVTVILASLLMGLAASERRARATAIEITRARRDVESRMRSVIENTADGIITVDSASLVLSMNRSAEQMFGYSALEVVGQDVKMLLPKPLWPEYAAFITQFQARTERAAAATRRDGVGLRRDGTEFPISIALNRIRGDGRNEYVLLIGDTGERIRAQQALEVAEHAYRAVVNVLEEGMLLMDDEARIVSCNPAAERILGIGIEDKPGINVQQLLWRPIREDGSEWPADDVPALRTLRTGRPMKDEVIGLYRPDGALCWLKANTALVPDVGEPGHYGVVFVFSDISERKRAENALAESSRLRQAILDNAPLAIFSTDEQGMVRNMNPAAERLLRCPRDEVIGKLALDALFDPAELSTRAAALSAEVDEYIAPNFEVLVHKARQDVSEEREWTMIRKDGTRVPVHLAISALRDGNGAVAGFFGISSDITERKRREEYTRHIAHHDHLTGLPNRVLLQDRLQVATERARRDRTHVGVLMIDLDRFKRINDSLGHHVGDELLWTIADRLRGCIRSGDTVARMGGDEFVIMLPDVKNPDSVRRVASTVVERVSAQAIVGEHELYVTPSVGVSVFPADGDDVYALLKHADMAMYHAKASGRRCYRVFSHEMERVAAEKLDLEGSLRRALQRDEFLVYYQPQVNLADGRILGMEALLRWNHPLRGPVPPHNFIPIAEETGLIVALGEWTLRKACQDCRTLQDRSDLPLHLSVNLSPRQFRQPNMELVIEHALRDSGLDPACMQLEMTESVLIEDADETLGRLQRLRQLGVGITVDDFGIGYSSLSHLARFPIDTLKIDRSFIQKVPHSASDAAVVQAIIALAHSLNVKVVAEGIENAAQCEFLRARGCDAGEGYHFGLGVPLDEFQTGVFAFPSDVAAGATAGLDLTQGPE